MGLWNSIATAEWNPFRRKSVILDNQQFLDSLQQGPVNEEFGVINFPTIPLSPQVRNMARLLDSQRLIVQPQEGRKWFDVIGKIKDAMPGAGSWIQSTLTKVIILVIIVAIIALFGVSYVNAQANKLALAK